MRGFTAISCDRTSRQLRLRLPAAVAVAIGLFRCGSASRSDSRVVWCKKSRCTARGRQALLHGPDSISEVERKVVGCLYPDKVSVCTTSGRPWKCVGIGPMRRVAQEGELGVRCDMRGEFVECILRRSRGVDLARVLTRVQYNSGQNRETSKGA